MGKDATSALLPGTLELLILKTLTAGELHGHAIAQCVKSRSEDVLEVGESSLYPALQRLLLKGWVKAEWGASENNRRATHAHRDRAQADGSRTRGVRPRYPCHSQSPERDLDHARSYQTSVAPAATVTRRG